MIPRGAIVAYRELYGVKTKPDGTYQPDVGLKEPSDVVARKVMALESKDECISYGVLDPAAFAQNGGPSIAENMAREGLLFRGADNKRVATQGAIGGHDQFRKRLAGDADGRPMIYFFANCIHAIRTIPVLQHDATHPEDVDTDMEDHAYDDSRYAAMSRPWVAEGPSSPEEAERQIMIKAQQERMRAAAKRNKRA